MRPESQILDGIVSKTKRGRVRAVKFKYRCLERLRNVRHSPVYATKKTKKRIRYIEHVETGLNGKYTRIKFPKRPSRVVAHDEMLTASFAGIVDLGVGISIN